MMYAAAAHFAYRVILPVTVKGKAAGMVLPESVYI
jgi:hypothetical protein